MQLLDNPFWRDPDGTHEECGFLLDDDIDEVGQLSLLVVVLERKIESGLFL